MLYIIHLISDISYIIRYLLYVILYTLCIVSYILHVLYYILHVTLDDLSLSIYIWAAASNPGLQAIGSWA